MAHLYTIEFTAHGNPFTLPCAHLCTFLRAMRNFKASRYHHVTGVLVDGERRELPMAV